MKAKKIKRKYMCINDDLQMLVTSFVEDYGDTPKLKDFLDWLDEEFNLCQYEETDEEYYWNW